MIRQGGIITPAACCRQREDVGLPRDYPRPSRQTMYWSPVMIETLVETPTRIDTLRRPQGQRIVPQPCDATVQYTAKVRNGAISHDLPSRSTRGNACSDQFGHIRQIRDHMIPLHPRLLGK